MARLGSARVILSDVTLQSAEAVQTLGPAIDAIGAEAAADTFQVPVELSITLENGSLKAAAVVVGMMFSTYYFVGNYKAFKEGVVEICADVDRFGNQFCSHVIASLDPRRVGPPQRPREIVDQGTPGRLLELLKKLDWLDDQNLDPEIRWLSLPRESRQIRLTEMAGELDAIYADVSDEEREAIAQSLQFVNLPPPSEWPRDPRPKESPNVIKESEPGGILEQRVRRRTVDRSAPRAPRRLVYRNKITVRPSDKRLSKPHPTAL